MNNDVEVEGRPRPLSTGLWTFFSWLRRDDRFDSSDSLSSAGSDRTVASFAFLTPAHYQPVTTPFVLPPPGPPTDSYKKRVHDRNLRRQYDRDLTLHRKYGLFKSGETTCGYDAFSLPPVRRINVESSGRWDRDRRATSECYQRRLAHVPGKRRAPLPPTLTASTALPTSLTRNGTRKRRAPQPPVTVIEKNKENINNVKEKLIASQMNPHSAHEKQKIRSNDLALGCKSEKYSKQEGCIKDTKIKPEKSFLKQIFDSKKRNSGIDISSVKLLPSISELDKQAAEIIETYKINASEQNYNVKNIVLDKIDTQRSSQHETWICVSCLRKYNSSIITCLHCFANNKTGPVDRDNSDGSSASKASNTYTQTEKKLPKSTSTNKNAVEEKQKLKEMLKEMKDSLPKRPKHDLNSKNDSKSVVISEPGTSSSYSTDTPTLRVGCTSQNENKIPPITQPTTSNVLLKSALPVPISITRQQTPITQSAQAVSVVPKIKKTVNISTNQANAESNVGNTRDINPGITIEKTIQTKVTPTENSKQLKDMSDLHTPLKISSLLNPVYIPKKSESTKLLSNFCQTSTESKTEKQKITEVINDNNNRASRKTGDLSTTNEAVTSSKSQLGLLSMTNKDETKSKIETKKTTKPSMCSQNDNVAEVKKNKIVEIEFKNNKMSTTNKEQNILKSNTQDQHSRRRDLIHQLEQSIAKGDEVAAAEAAAKLAQLRLSCSVLSFSSQILSEPSTSSAHTSGIAEINSNKVCTKSNKFENKLKREPQVIQLSSIKERSPQKVVVRNVISSSGLVKTTTATPACNTESLQDERLQNNQESIVKKIVCESKKENPITNDAMITISVLVEDREATRGPVHLRIRRQALMRDLRREAATLLGLAANLQRWIVGRTLCVNDNTPIISLAGTDFDAPFYLCVVESETKIDPIAQTKNVEKLNNVNINPQQTKTGNVYTELVQLEQQALVPNAENFECGVCMEEYAPGRGVVLRECVHIFCKDCLADVVRHCEEPDVSCPSMGCRGMLQEREIRALVTPQDYERWLARGLAAAESGTRNAFHCRTRDCKGWALCEPGVQRFPCPVCKHINCVPCQAIHNNETCEQHRAKLEEAAAGKNAKGSNETDDGTRTLLNSLIAKGEALECPECSAIITKKWGCDWVKCSACKTEICWVTRGRRWGPGGKGDTSAGCRCGVDGKRCHPSCGYCH